MNNYITGKIIKELREKQNQTQAELGNIIGVSDKTVSKWETGKGLPDISLIEPLSSALKVSVIELMSGEYIINQNKSANMLKSKFSVCPICGNIIHSMGESLISCCGISLPQLDSEDENEDHKINCEYIENEYYVTVGHEMTKEHYISFIAYVTGGRCEIQKLYPEQTAEARFLKRGRGKIIVFCNKDGLFKKDI
ncbi:MAG: helix-turn-helix domain-containing protein [Clostridia bacterium]|nr:helix-turn-helix domain-containing protein [Clostridia bacterium]